MKLTDQTTELSAVEKAVFGADCDSVEPEEYWSERGDVLLAYTRVTWRDGSSAMLTPERMAMLIAATRPMFSMEAV